MDPGINELMYKPLVYTSRQIRLLRLRSRDKDSIFCTLKTFELTECPPYKALSYTWGPISPGYSIQIDGQTFHVRQNLWDFLNIWGEKCTWLWVDAICINQKSTQERNHQVQFMHDIYRRAQEVLIWLGQEENDSAHAIHYLHYWNNHSALTEKASETDRDLAVQARAMESLLRRSYWSRVWVIQEILHGRLLTILCGGFQVQWEAFTRFVEWHLHPELIALRKQLRGVPHPSLQLQIIGPVRSIITMKKRYTAKSPQGRRITTVLKEFEYSQSTDVRDKVFALLSLVKEECRAPVYYEISPRRLLFDVLRKAAETECLLVSLNDHIRFALSLQRSLKVFEYEKDTIRRFVTNEVSRQKKLVLRSQVPAYKLVVNETDD